MNPPIKTLSPVSTRRRVEMFPKVPGVSVGVAEGGGVGVAVGVGVAAGVGVGVGVGTGVGVGVAGGVGVTIGVAVAVGDGVGVGPVELIVKPVSFTRVAKPGPTSVSPVLAPATRTNARSQV